jgi:hypothetical protein
MLGFGLVLWALVLPPMSKDEWSTAMGTIAAHMA